MNSQKNPDGFIAEGRTHYLNHVSFGQGFAGSAAAFCRIVDVTRRMTSDIPAYTVPA
jgi:hypothetical protein